MILILNVLFIFTVIRRKSASERLAESRSKYIRSDPDEAEYSPGAANTLALATNDGGQSWGDDELSDVHLVSGCPMRQLRATPTSTKSSHTSSSRLSPISDNVCNHAQEERCPAASGALRSHGNLVDRIHCQLNKSKQYSISSCPKKRVSPRNSDGSSLSNGMTKLEMKLRELITIDTGHELLSEPTLQLNAPSHRPPSVQVEVPVGQHPETLEQEREARHIYRAEPKFIGSSTSSLSSMYSEPNNLSLSDKGSVAPSAEPKATCQPTANFAVVRSKSDASPKKQVIEKYRGSHIERLFGSLGLDSQYYQPGNEQLPTRKVALYPAKGDKTWESSNQNGYSIVESPMHESLFKRCAQDAVDGALPRKGLSKATSLSTPKSGSTNELSSLESSQLSVSEHICKGALNHSKSTSKLTMENLLMHQQNLASSRSCHNLVISQQSGPSVVERNAKIIKWLVHVNKAMGQPPSWHA